ncbi:hypothetical protein V5P93_005704 [Actinokineospora auranticolor]|uniref:ABC-type transport system involved in multi-copper enzyme maturation permease subunit n=1 Tax=Actinokineospora auranticolor TaxID=155976 RepID=A0A2S6GF68_9PSEU|nr:hypothetical protein [Actinokineospora auranticolor]PPK63830.1 hypothetical protein CLV40_12474 [Actinokineospora auranticolor]
MTGPLRLQLRRSAAIAVGVGLAVLLLAMAHLMSGPWTKGDAAWSRDWTGLAEWSRYLLLFAWPLVLGAGAWQGARDSRSGVDELLSTVPVGQWRRAVPVAGALALGVVAGYLGLVVVGVVRVLAGGADFRADWLVVALVGALGLIAVALLGLGIGRVFPSAMTPPIAAVAGLAAQVAMVWQSSTSGAALVFSPAAGGGGVSVFTQVAARVSVAQVVWFSMVALSGLLLFALASRSRLLAVVPVAVGVLSVVLVAPPGSAVHVADTRALAVTCSDDTPRLCLTEAHEDRRAALTEPARRAVAALAVLPGAPTSVVEHPTALDLPRRPVAPDAVAVDLSDPAFRDGTPEDLFTAMIAGAGTPVCSTVDTPYDRVRREVAARTVTVGWFTGELGPLPGYDYLWKDSRPLVDKAWGQLSALPRERQVEQVAAVRAAALRCDSDLLAVLEER